MTSVNDTRNGVEEEKAFDDFNISQGKEALDLANEDSFQSIGSPPSAYTSVNSDGLDTTAELSGESTLPSPDSAIGGTPGLTPDLESPLDQTTLGKITEDKGIIVQPEIHTPVNEVPAKDLLSEDVIHQDKPQLMVIENALESEEDEEDADSPDSETASTASSSSSSLLVVEKEDRDITDLAEIEAPTLTLIDYELNTEKPIHKGPAPSSIIDSVETQPVSPTQMPLVPSVVVKEDDSTRYQNLAESPKSSNHAIADTEIPGKASSVKTFADVEEFIADVLVSGKAVAEKRGNQVDVTRGDSVGIRIEDPNLGMKREPCIKGVSMSLQKVEAIPSSPEVDPFSKVEVETNTSLPENVKASTVSDPDPESADVQKPDLMPETLNVALDESCNLKFAGSPVKQNTSLTAPLVIPEIKVELEDDSPLEDEKDVGLENTTEEEEEKKVSPVNAEVKLEKNNLIEVKKKVETDVSTEEEEDKKGKTAPLVAVAPPEVKNDKVEDGGYEEDEEDEEGEDEDDVLSDSELVVEASMKFPLASKANVEEVPVEQKQSDAPVADEPIVAESAPEVAVEMSVQVTHSTLKEATPSGCESDIEDNDEDDTEGVPVVEAPSLAAAPANRIPTTIELPETVVRLDTPEGSSVFLVGTAHFSRESQDDVSNTIRAVKPDIVVVELCKARTAILQLDEETILEESRSLDFRKVQMILRQHGKVQGILYLLLLSVSAHITKQLGMAPGGEFRTAFAEARRSAPGCLIQFGDRPIQVTLSRALASLSLWHKIKLTWHILTSKEPISKEEVEKCKQRDFIEEMLAEMTGQFPAISEVFVKERDIYLCRSLQAAAQPVPNPMSPSGIAPRIVVGVVGIGHVPGIVERWGKVTDKDIPPIMEIPPTSLGTQVLKYTFKVTFYGLLGYGAYKCLPSSTKSSIQASVQSVLKTVADALPQKWLK